MNEYLHKWKIKIIKFACKNVHAILLKLNKDFQKKENTI